jgi:hypothetical protein
VIYLECKQNFYTSTTVSFSGNSIGTSANDFSGFNAGDKIIIKGSLNAVNDVQRKIVSASASGIVVDGAALTTQSAGLEITIQKIEFFSDPDGYYIDQRGITQYFFCGILEFGEVSYTEDSGFVKLNDGTVSLKRRGLLGEDGQTVFDLSDKKKLFEFYVKFDDFLLFDNVKGIIRDLDELTIVFQLKSDIYDSNWLDAAHDLNDPLSYTQGRVLPKVIGSLNHFNALLQDDTTYDYYSGGTTMSAAYDDGNLVEFNDVVTSYTYPKDINYGDYHYKKNNTGSSATMSPTGANTNNVDWSQHGAADPLYDYFEATAYTFNLANQPDGEVTIDIEGEYNTLETLAESLSGLVQVRDQKLINNTISFTASTKRITSTSPIFLGFAGADTDITGQRIEITGSTSNNGYYRISSVDASGYYVVVTGSLVDETAGNTITLQGYYGFSKEYSSATAAINYGFITQQKILDVLKEICAYHEHIFIFDRATKLMYLIDKEQYSSSKSLDQYSINRDEGVSYLTKDVVFSFVSSWIQRIAIQSPSSILNMERKTEVTTGLNIGTIEIINSFDINNSAIQTALEKKRDLFLDWDRIQIVYTIDGEGIDSAIFPGQRVQFSDWISGDLHIQEIAWDFSSGQTTIRGIAQNITFGD